MKNKRDKTTLFLLKHGETVSSVIGEKTLSNKGFVQVERAQDYLLLKKITKIYSSNRIRAIQSIQRLADITAIKIETSKLLKDKERPKTQIKDYKLYVEKSINNVNFKLDNEETIDEVTQRLKKISLKIIERHVGESIAISTHGICIAILISQFNMQNPFEIWKCIKPGDLYMIDINDRKNTVSKIL